MKIILTKDIDSLGKEGITIEVSNGYARNYLIPRRLAIPATKEAQKFYEKKRKKLEEKLTAQKAELEELAKKLESLELIIRVDAQESGKLFGSVTSSNIAEAIKEALGIEIDRRKIELPEHIKGVGAYEIPIKLHPDVICKVKFKVEAK